MKGSHGKMQNTRKKLKKKGKVAPNQFLKEFNEGEKVQISIEPSSHKGMPHPRFNGNIGKVKSKKGGSYRIKIKEGGKEKEIISNPEHLKKVKVD